MSRETNALLLSLCQLVYRANKLASAERLRDIFGDDPPLELYVIKSEKIRVEIRKENVNHHEPHLHITHSDKIDASLSLKDFRILAGEIDRKTMRHLLPMLSSVQPKLIEIWETLNEEENSIGAETLIKNLFN